MVAYGVMSIAIAAGAVVQRSIGFGFALVVVPVLELVRPGSVPVTVLVLALPMTVSMAVAERAHVDVRGFGWIVAGRVVGTAAAVAVLVSISSAALSATVGSIVVLAVVLSAAGVDVRPTPAVAAGAGFLSGVMGTTSAIGGPALAVVYQRRPGPELRSTLAVAFVVGIVISFLALLAAGQVEASNGVLAIALLPALIAGLAAGPRLARRLDGRWLRPVVLTFAATAGAALVVRSW